MAACLCKNISRDRALTVPRQFIPPLVTWCLESSSLYSCEICFSMNCSYPSSTRREPDVCRKSSLSLPVFPFPVCSILPQMMWLQQCSFNHISMPRNERDSLATVKTDQRSTPDRSNSMCKALYQVGTRFIKGTEWGQHGWNSEWCNEAG